MACPPRPPRLSIELVPEVDQRSRAEWVTTSVFSGRSRRPAHPHHRRSECCPLSDPGDHFGRGDHFEKLHPICTHMQGQAIQRLLTALTCEYSPIRQHRAPSTAAQKR